jgi:hypothetical protein
MSSAIHKLPADYPIFRGKSGHAPDITAMIGFDFPAPGLLRRKLTH